MRMKDGFSMLLIFILMLVSLPGCITVPGDLSALSFLPVVKTFEASPAVIKAGEYSTLSWEVTGASKVYIDNIGNVALKGSSPVTPAGTAYYTLTASNSSGSSTARVQVVVTGQAQPQAPVINSFFSDRNNINPGDAVIIYWDTSGAALVTLDPGGTVAAQGNSTVNPYATSDYILTVSNSSGIAKRTLTVTVNTPYGGQPGAEKVVVLPAVADESGSLVKNNAVYTIQENACTGDTSLNLASRAFLSFNITGIPADATIQEAVLDLSSYSETGSPTYTVASWGNMGAIEIYYYQYGKLSDLDIMSYNRTAPLAAGGNIIEYPGSPWRVDVKNSSTGEPVVQDLVRSGQARCQFRIQFFTSTNWDSKADMFCFDDAKLIVKYTTP